LSESAEGIKYLIQDRGLTQATAEHFCLGYSKEYNAISIPVFKDGELIDIKYRLLKPTESKYLREKNTETWIYNEDGIQKGIAKGTVLVVEGEFDLMSAWQKGVKNIVSPASGKDSYGVWLEQLDNIPKVYIAYDNDKGGRETSYKMAERIGMDRSFEVKYPEGIKDANEFFKKYAIEDFRKLVKEAKPYYTHQFKGISDIIKGLMQNKDDTVKLTLMPKVNIEKDWLIVVSGKSNVGKTSYVLNVVDELADKNIPTLVMPFERGIESVGKRFVQIKFNKTTEDFKFMKDSQWENLVDECVDLPIYFTLPKKNDIIDTIIKARRLFNTKFVIIDHLDYIVRNTGSNKEAEIGHTLQELKRVAEDYGVTMIIVTHIRKIDVAGASDFTAKKPSMEDLKGSSSLYQDPECVIMLTGDENNITVDVVKNKGEMSGAGFDFNTNTGKLTLDAFENG